MHKQTILNILKIEKPYLKERFGVEEIGLFGSYARGEEQVGSDIDILVKMQKQSISSYFNLLDFLEAKLRVKVDLVTKHKNLSERFVRLVSKDIIYV